MSEKLKTKDFVTIGVFTVIYFIMMFTVGMMGMVPILFLIYPFFNAIVGGVIVMLFMAKVPKPWALFIFGILSPLIMFLMGHTYVLLVESIIVMLIAEMIFRAGKFKSFKFNALANAVFSCWICGSLLQILLIKDKYMEMTVKMMGDEYAKALETLVTPSTIVLIYLGAFIGGLIGAYLGKIMFKKHFEKAGIV